MDEKKLLRDDIAFVVRYQRQRRGWTQSDLAKRADVHQVMVSRIERAIVIPSTWTLYLLAKSFGLTLSDFFAIEYRHPQIIEEREKLQ